MAQGRNGLEKRIRRGRLADFHEWSRPAENYDARENKTRWQSFKPGGGITIATVFGMARDACWRDDGTYRVPEPEELAARARKRAEEGFAQKRSRDISVAEAVKKARVVLSISDPATPDNPYCRRKGIMPTETLRDMDVAKAETVLGYAGQRLQGRCLVAPIKRDVSVRACN